LTKLIAIKVVNLNLTETLPLIASINQKNNYEDKIAVPSDFAILYELSFFDLLFDDVKLSRLKLFKDLIFVGL
jgi:hypothetical protein